MDPARMFMESLTLRPELENSQGQNLRCSRDRTWSVFWPTADVSSHPDSIGANQPILPEQTRTLVAFDFGVDVELGAGGHVGGHFDGRPNVGWVRDK